MPNYSGRFARPYLFKLAPSRWLRIWWTGLHGLLMLALFMANLPVMAVAAVALALVLHYRWRRPATCRLLVVSPGGRFALPAEGRFGIGLTDKASMGGIWIELRFCDRPDAALTLLRDQFTESDWRRLRLVLKEGY